MTANAPKLDLALAHRHFSADCFNRTWTYLEKLERTAADDEAMILLAMASLWHWTQRPDCTDQNLSIGHWQIARVFALLGQGDNALRHALRCLDYAAGSPPFFVGYAHEAIARAALVSGDDVRFEDHLRQACELAALVDDTDERKQLQSDLEALMPKRRNGS